MGVLLAYVETPNQCRLTRMILPELRAAGHELDLVVLRRFIGDALAASVATVGARFVYAPDDHLRRGATRAELYRHLPSVTRRVREIVRDYDLFVCWNDGTNTARPMVEAVRTRRVPVLVLQDGFLDQEPHFEGTFGDDYQTLVKPAMGASKPPSWLRWTARELYFPRFRFGSTQADRYLVFGEAMRSKMSALHGVSPQKVAVIGSPDLTPRALSFAEGATPIVTTGRPLRILFVDQCHVAHGKMTHVAWRSSFAALMGVLAPYATTLKTHPGEKESIRSEILRTYASQVRIIAGGFVQELEWSNYDLVVTATSSSFLDALSAHVPVVLVKLPGLIEAFPQVRSRAIRSCDSLKELADFLQQTSDSRRFEGNDAGCSLSYLFFQDFASSYGARVAHHVDELLAPRAAFRN